MYSHQLGFNVMSINYRGYGTSEGQPTEKGLYQDAQATYGKLFEMGFTPEQIIVHGYSMGAAVAGQLHKAADAAGVPLNGVVYDRPMVSTRDATEAHTGSARIGSMAERAVGPMDIRETVPSLTGKTTPILVSYDRLKDNLFAQQCMAFGDSLTEAGFTNVRLVGTHGGHKEQAEAADAMRPQLGKLFR